MKWLKILIYSLPALMIFQPEPVTGQKASSALGIYDFTDRTTREFYLISPVLMAGYDVWNRNLLHLNVSGGFSYKSLKYNDHRHSLYMVPLMATCYYDLANPGADVNPVIGMGLSLMGKADRNKDFDKTHYSMTYGYHVTGGLRFRVNPKLILTLDLTYNGLVPPVPEEVDMRGVIITCGVRF